MWEVVTYRIKFAGMAICDIPVSDIAEIAEISEEEVKEIIDQNKGVVLV